MLLSALRALPRPWPVGIRVVCEGSEEMSTGGLEALVRSEPALFAAEVMLVADAGNIERGTPTVTSSLRGTGSVEVTVETLAGPVHSGMFGGAAPDALAALMSMLATLRDAEGRTTITGLDAGGRGRAPTTRSNGSAPTPASSTASRCSVRARWPMRCGRGRPSTCWPSTVPRCRRGDAAIQHTARAMVNLRVPPGTTPPTRRAARRAPRVRGPVGSPRPGRAAHARSSPSPLAPTGPVSQRSPRPWSRPSDAR